MAASASASGTTNLSESGKAPPKIPLAPQQILRRAAPLDCRFPTTSPAGLRLGKANQIPDGPVFLELQVFLLGARHDLDVLQFALDLARAHFGLVDGVGHRLQLALGVGQHLGELAELRLYRAEHFPHFRGALLDRKRAEAHLQAVEISQQVGRAADRDAELTLDVVE